MDGAGGRQDAPRRRERALGGGGQRIDESVREELGGLSGLDPEHMHASLAGIDAVSAAFPTVPQVAAFDTAFHATLPEAAAGYGLPFEWTVGPSSLRLPRAQRGVRGRANKRASRRPSLAIDRLPSWRRLLDHGGPGRPVARHHHGVLTARGPDDGHALGLGRSGGSAVPPAALRSGCRRAPRDSDEAFRTSRRVRDLRRSERGPRGRGQRLVARGARLRAVRALHSPGPGSDGGRSRGCGRGRVHRRHRREQRAGSSGCHERAPVCGARARRGCGRVEQRRPRHRRSGLSGSRPGRSGARGPGNPQGGAPLPLQERAG